MSRWYNAHEAILAVVNQAMAEASDREAAERIRREHTEAFAASIPRDLDLDWPDLAAIAERLGDAFIGVTSDTRKAVAWDAGAFIIVE